jgi:hypothetical protein
MHQFKEHGFPETRGPNAERKRHLELVDRVRTEQPQRDLGFAGLVASIPPLDWAVLKIRFPELVCGDSEIEHQAWAVFLKHPASEPYRVTRRKVRRGGNGRGY